MKRNQLNNLFTRFGVVIIFTLMVIMVGCKPTPEPTTLFAPTNIVVVDGLISWDAIDNATGYSVKINQIETNIDNLTEYQIPNTFTGLLSIQVKAKGDGQTTLDSEYSELVNHIVKVALAQPTNLRLDDTVIRWNAVQNATNYTVNINNTTILTNVTSLEASVGDLSGTFMVYVQAFGDSTYYLSSPIASTQVYVPIPLDTPENLRKDDSLLVWDAVTNATSYEVYINEILKTTVSVTQYQIETTELETEDMFITIKAKAEGYRDSLLSDSIDVGLGSEGNPLQILTESNLRAIKLNKHYTLGSDLTLTSDWTPIGSLLHPFTGSFDGNGYTIYGLSIVANELSYVGLFGATLGASVSNFNVDQPQVTIMTSASQSTIGIVIGLAIDTTMEDIVISNGTIIAALNNGLGSLGGAIGRMDDGLIRNVQSQIDITAHNYEVGGLVGRLGDGAIATIVERSSAQGTIQVSGGRETHTGGLIGSIRTNTGHVNKSYALVDVSGVGNVGGLVGFIGFGRITDAYAIGNVQSVSDGISYAGGLIGLFGGLNIQIHNAYAVGIVTASADTISYAGGFIGKIDVGSMPENAILRCYYDSSVSTTSQAIGSVSTSTSDGISGLSTELMQALDASITSWNTDIWMFPDSNYPTLRSGLE